MCVVYYLNHITETYNVNYKS